MPWPVHALSAAAAYFGDLCADEDLCCQAHNRYTALLLLGLLYGVPDPSRVATGQASKQEEHLKQPVRGLWRPHVERSMGIPVTGTAVQCCYIRLPQVPACTATLCASDAGCTLAGGDEHTSLWP